MKKSAIRYKKTIPLDITFHYTNEQMVKDLIAITPISGSVLDAGSGKNRVWFNNLLGEKMECEIENGCDFLTQWDKKVDWVIGNPPFSLGWKFFEKSLGIANKGIAFLGSIQFFNQFTPRRQQIIRDNGFYLQRIHTVADKRWFGRYYYLIFTKTPNEFLSWNTKTY